MLVLSRKRNQKVILTDKLTGERIVLEQLDIRGDKSRLGITATDRFVIHREEVQEAIDQETADRETATPV